jgi:hypothetical protein
MNTRIAMYSGIGSYQVLYYSVTAVHCRPRQCVVVHSLGKNRRTRTNPSRGFSGIRIGSAGNVSQEIQVQNWRGMVREGDRSFPERFASSASATAHPCFQENMSGLVMVYLALRLSSALKLTEDRPYEVQPTDSKADIPSTLPPELQV